MLFRQLFDAKSCTYTYLLASNYGREALFIDPVLEQVALYTRLLQEYQLQLAITLDTHTHADHITASGWLHQHYRSRITMGKHTQAQGVHQIVQEGDVIELDGLSLKVIHTPGHTKDSYSFYLSDRIFTGDTLLIRSTGRTDFQEGDAYQQYDSLFNKLLALPDETLVYPAHNYDGITVSTIREEKQWNPRLQVSSANEYATMMKRLNLAKPHLMEIAVPANLRCGLEGHSALIR
ncbi:MAG: Zn-dependent hydrolase [Coxiella sp. RIFCSPHIGHO2_12_FULL_44_14]|nr:MAG: Zn-dependent hydrolase [Coxiella sp. RIFCSPHIGHO2_12_FULL_44_14]